MKKKQVVKGAGFNSTINSQHTWRGIRTINPKPERFDHYDPRDALKPAPTQYNPKDVNQKKQRPGYIISK